MPAMEPLKSVRGGKWLNPLRNSVAQWFRGLSLKQHLLLIALTPFLLLSVAILLLFRLAGDAHSRRLEDAAKERGLAIVQLLAPAAEFGIAVRSPPHLNYLLQTVLDQHDVAAVVIYNHAGEAIVEGGRPEVAAPRLLVSTTRARFMEERSGRMSFAAPVTTAPAVLDDIVAGGMPAEAPLAPDTMGWVYVELDTSASVQRENSAMLLFLLLAVVTLLFSAYSALRLAHKVGDPVAHLARAVRRMLKGDVDASVPVDAVSPELQALQDGVNALGRAVASLQRTMHRRIEETTGILAYQARHDPLTGLSNRRAFEEALDDVILASRRASDQSALCFMDLDNFKLVNDAGGRAAGDALLCEIAVLIQHRLRTQDLICRIGGDEFVLILRGCTRDDAKSIALGLCEAIAGLSFYWEDACFKVSASIGLTHIDESVTNKTDLLKAADAACYTAKRQGRNQVVVDQGASLV